MPAEMDHQQYERAPCPSRPNSSIHKAADPAPTRTAPGRAGSGSRYAGRGARPGKRPDGVRAVGHDGTSGGTFGRSEPGCTSSHLLRPWSLPSLSSSGA
jgi:hypothetical protein